MTATELIALVVVGEHAAVEADKIAQAAGKQGDKGDIYKQLIQKKIGQNGEILDSQLIKSAEDATFQTELDGMAARFQNFVNAAPLGRQLVPFIRTPHNILVYGAQHVPGLTRFTDEWKHTMKFGTPEAQAILRGRAALGYVYFSGAAGLASAGLLTGNGPLDPEERRMWRRNHEPMSLKVGDKWVSYKALPGVEHIFSTVADMTETIRDYPPETASELLASGAYFLANAVANRSYFQGYVEAAALLDPRNWTKDGMIKAVGDRLNTTLGGAGLRNQFENFQRENMYEYRTWMDGVAGKVTGGVLGNKVPTVDVLTGQPLLNGYENPWNSVNPFKVVGKDVSPLVEGLADVGYSLNDVITGSVDKAQLDPEMEKVVREGMYDDGNFPRALKAVLNSESFKREHQRWLDKRGEYDQEKKEESAWYKRLSRVVNKYRAKGVRSLRSDKSSVGEAFRDRREVQRAGMTNGLEAFMSFFAK